MSTNNFPTNRELIQQSVFVRWCNKHLLKVNKQITNLERDFSDGIKLNDLLQILSEKQVKPYYKWPFFRLMKEENVQQAISFMRSEGIDVDGVDSKAVVEGNLKLNLRLVWSLICHYSLSALKLGEKTGQKKTHSFEANLLLWIQNQIPQIAIKNLTSSWQDGKALAALTDKFAPGSCPDWTSWNSEKQVENTRKVMNLAENYLVISQLILPEEIIDPQVDEQSVATYLSQFLSIQVQPDDGTTTEIFNLSPLETQTSLTQDGINVVDEFMGFLEDKDLDDTLPTITCDDENEEDRNASENVSLIKDGSPNTLLDIQDDQLLNTMNFLDEMDESVSSENLKVKKDSSVAGNHVKPVKDWLPVFDECQEDSSSLRIDAAELALLVATIKSPSGQTDNCLMKKLPNGDVGITFTPKEPGRHILSVTKHGKHLTNSPFTIMVDGMKKETPESISDVTTTQPVESKAVKQASELFLNNNNNSKDAGSSPHEQTTQKIASGSLMQLAELEQTKEEPKKTEEKTQLLHKIADEELNLLSASIQYSSGQTRNCDLQRQSDENIGISFPFLGTGQHIVSIKRKGEHITNSPFKVVLKENKDKNKRVFNKRSDVGKIFAYGLGLQKPVSGKNNFTVNCTGAGNNMLMVGFQGPQYSCEEVSVKYLGKRKYKVTYHAEETGNYVMAVMWGLKHIPGSPFHFTIT